MIYTCSIVLVYITWISWEFPITFTLEAVLPLGSQKVTGWRLLCCCPDSNIFVFLPRCDNSQPERLHDFQGAFEGETAHMRLL